MSTCTITKAIPYKAQLIFRFGKFYHTILTVRAKNNFKLGQVGSAYAPHSFVRLPNMTQALRLITPVSDLKNILFPCVWFQKSHGLAWVLTLYRDVTEHHDSVSELIQFSDFIIKKHINTLKVNVVETFRSTSVCEAMRISCRMCLYSL